MKINYRIRRAVKAVKECLADEYKIMAKHASHYVGKEFNTTSGWKSKGKIEGLEAVHSILIENDLYEWS